MLIMHYEAFISVKITSKIKKQFIDFLHLYENKAKY